VPARMLMRRGRLNACNIFANPHYNTTPHHTTPHRQHTTAFQQRTAPPTIRDHNLTAFHIRHVQSSLFTHHSWTVTLSNSFSSRACTRQVGTPRS
jgi:hypothetical protein